MGLQADWGEIDGGKVRTWLYRVAGNLCIARLRARRPEAPIEAVEETGVIDIQPYLDGQLDTRRSLHKALLTLPDRQQTVLILVYYQGHTVKEAAVILRLSEHAAEALLARAHRAMRLALAPDRDDLIGVSK